MLKLAKAHTTSAWGGARRVRRLVFFDVLLAFEVYSFGMVLLELLTAHPPAYMSRKGDGRQVQVG